MLLMHSFSNPDMKNWLPLIMNSEKPMTDKLLMMSFMRQQESTGLSANNEMLPLLLMNDGRGCKVDINGVQKVSMDIRTEPSGPVLTSLTKL